KQISQNRKKTAINHERGSRRQHRISEHKKLQSSPVIRSRRVEREKIPIRNLPSQNSLGAFQHYAFIRIKRGIGFKKLQVQASSCKNQQGKISGLNQFLGNAVCGLLGLDLQSRRSLFGSG